MGDIGENLGVRASSQQELLRNLTNSTADSLRCVHTQISSLQTQYNSRFVSILIPEYT